jgi:hypothetical protein
MTLVWHVTWNCGNNSVHIYSHQPTQSTTLADNRNVCGYQWTTISIQVSNTSLDQVYSYFAYILRSIELILFICRQGKTGSTAIRDKLDRCFSWLLGRQKYMNSHDICATHILEIRRETLNICCFLDIRNVAHFRYLGTTATNQNLI